MDDFDFFLLVTVLLAFVLIQQMLRHQRRLLVHKERLAAIEKGLELPAVEREIEGRGFNVQRTLLLVGLVWISLGVGALSGDVSSLIGNPISVPLGVALIGIGVSHLIVFAFGAWRGER